MRKLPSETKILQGTFERSREGFESVEYADYERSPTCPPEWPDRYKYLWLARCHDLKQAGYLTKAFVPALRMYFEWFIIYERAAILVNEQGAVIEKDGSQGQVYNVVNPNLAVMDSSMKWVDKLGAQFGFTPLAASKIPKTTKHIEEDESLLK